MELFKCILILLINLCAGNLYENYKVFSTGPLETWTQAEAIAALEHEDSNQVELLQGAPVPGSALQLLVSPRSVTMVTRALTQAGIEYTVILENVQRSLDEGVKQNRNSRKMWKRSRRMVRSVRLDAWDRSHVYHPPEHYMHWDEQVDYIKHLADTSRIATYSTFGTSHHGRSLPLIVINSERWELPGVWVDAGMHAREWLTHATLIYILETILFAQTTEANHLRDNYRIYVAPNLNPDGYVYSWTTDRLWRKNMNNVTSNGWGGVDLNRNFDVKFGHCFSSHYPRSVLYKGRAPASEAETQAIVREIQRIQTERGGIQTLITLHSYGQRWLAPWGSTHAPPQDGETLVEVANTAVGAIRDTSGLNFTEGVAADALYCFSGSLLDWAKNNGDLPGSGARIAHAYLVELRPSCCGQEGFVVDPSHIAPSGQEIFAAIYATLQAIE